MSSKEIIFANLTVLEHTEVRNKKTTKEVKLTNCVLKSCDKFYKGKKIIKIEKIKSLGYTNK